MLDLDHLYLWFINAIDSKNNIRYFYKPIENILFGFDHRTLQPNTSNPSYSERANSLNSQIDKKIKEYLQNPEHFLEIKKLSFEEKRQFLEHYVSTTKEGYFKKELEKKLINFDKEDSLYMLFTDRTKPLEYEFDELLQFDLARGKFLIDRCNKEIVNNDINIAVLSLLW